MIPGMPRVPEYPDTVRITALDAEGKPVSGGAATVTGRITRITTAPCLDQQDWREKVWAERHAALKKMAVTMDVPPFLQEELAREDDHALKVRRDKKRKELAELYGAAPAKWLDAAADQQTPRFPPSPPVNTVHEHYVMGAGPVSYQYSYDAVTGQEKWKKIPPCKPVPTTSPSVTGGWYAPTKTIYHDYDQPELRTGNHPCTLAYDTETDRQEEGPHSMYTNAAINQAAHTLQQEREAREAAEIIDRIKAFGEDVYADATVLRFTREFYKNAAKTQLHDPAVFSALRYTDSFGNTTWSDDTGTKRTWDALVTWFVTHGKPITLDDVEIFPPAVFETTAGSGETRTVPASDL